MNVLLSVRFSAGERVESPKPVDKITRTLTLEGALGSHNVVVMVCDTASVEEFDW